MKRISPRHRLLLGALLLVAIVGLVDTLTRRAGPTQAQAAAAKPAKAVSDTPHVPDVAELVARLTSENYSPVSNALEQLPRDLFQPTPHMAPILAQAEPEPLSEPDVPQPGFEERHKLVGVVIGPNPLAVIDDRPLPLHAELDGYTLIEVHRDYVVFQERGGDERVVLPLRPRPEKP